MRTNEKKTKRVKNPAEKNLNLITKAQTTINGTPIKVTIMLKNLKRS